MEQIWVQILPPPSLSTWPWTSHWTFPSCSLLVCWRVNCEDQRRKKIHSKNICIQWVSTVFWAFSCSTNIRCAPVLCLSNPRGTESTPPNVSLLGFQTVCDTQMPSSVWRGPVSLVFIIPILAYHRMECGQVCPFESEISESLQKCSLLKHQT